MTVSNLSPSPEWVAFRRSYLLVAAFLAALLLLLLLTGHGPGGSVCRALLPGSVTAEGAAPLAAAAPAAVPVPPPVAAAPSASPPATALPAAAPLAADRVPPPLQVFFASGKAALPAEADRTLGPLVRYLVDHPQAAAAVTGFHDPSGSAAANAQLAKRRAVQVRDALVKLGVAPGQLVLSKPSVTTGGGSPAQSRRVEVVVGAR